MLFFNDYILYLENLHKCKFITSPWMDRWMDDRRVGGWWVGWMSKCVHGWVVGWMDIWMHGWMDN